MRLRRSSSAGTAAQTRAYAARPDVLAPQLRAEIATVPPAPHGRPALVVLMGLPGVGKSHCARLLCERIGAAHVASDELRRRMFIAPSYADVENRAIFGAVTALTDALLADGHRVVIDATNLLARNREPAVAVARRRGVPVTFIRVSGTDAETRARLASRRTARAANDHSEADESIYERMRDQRFEPPAEGFVDLANGEDLPAEIDRVVAAIEAEP